MTQPHSIHAPYRFAAAPYLNAQPLTYALRDRPDCSVVCDKPSALAAYLSERRADAALVPVVDCIADPSIRPVGNLGVAADGAVASVFLECVCPLDSVVKVVLDKASHTSNLLALLLLRHHHSTATPLPDSEPASEADATVIIGDRALGIEPTHRHVDLASLWKQVTGLPFVFAVWACRADHPAPDRLAAILAESYAQGCAVKSSIAKTFAPKLGVSYEKCLDYLEHRIRYERGPREQAAIQEFARQLDLHNLLATYPVGDPS